mgnify:CR=1 FL=1
MTEQEQIDALKAQVNCLREVIVKHTPIQIGKNGYELLDEVMGVLDSTPEQCLAEVKAKAIENVAEAIRNDEGYTYEDDYCIGFIYMHANQLREQAK